MAVINFSLSLPADTCYLPESAKFGHKIYVWNEAPIWVAGLLMERLCKGEIYFYA